MDTTDHASAMVLSYPEILSIDAPSAADIHTNTIAATVPTKILGRNLTSLGAATPRRQQDRVIPRAGLPLSP